MRNHYVHFLVTQAIEGRDKKVIEFDGGDGSALTVTQHMSGPAVEFAYGDRKQIVQVRFDQVANNLLYEMVCRIPLSAPEWEMNEDPLINFFRVGAYDILDLMDFCDKNHIGYTYMSWGSRGETAFRGPLYQHV